MGFRKSLGCSQSGVPGSACPPAAVAWGTAFRAALAKARAQGGLLGKPRSTPSLLNAPILARGPGRVPKEGRAVEKEIRANSDPSPGWGVLRLTCQPWTEAACLPPPVPSMLGFCPQRCSRTASLRGSCPPFLFPSGESEAQNMSGAESVFTAPPTAPSAPARSRSCSLVWRPLPGRRLG